MFRCDRSKKGTAKKSVLQNRTVKSDMMMWRETSLTGCSGSMLFRWQNVKGFSTKKQDS